MKKTTKITTGLYNLNIDGTNYALVCWNSFMGEGSKEWNVYEGSGQDIEDGNDLPWITTQRTKKEAIEYVS